MTRRTKIDPIEHSSEFVEEAGKNVLVLHNDDVNSFDFVIKSLVEVCKHNGEQAEQCAYITHYKGECDIKVGSYEFLTPMCESLRARGLSVTID